MINGHNRCHISTTPTLLINTLINKDLCSLWCSPVGCYTQYPHPPTIFSLFLSVGLQKCVFINFFLQSFFYRSPMSVSSPSLFYFSLFLSSLFLSLHLPLHFCHFSSFLYQNLYFSRCFLLHLSDFLPPLPAFLRPSLFLSAYSLCSQILNFFRLLNLFFSFAFSSLQSIFYLIP